MLRRPVEAVAGAVLGLLFVAGLVAFDINRVRPGIVRTPGTTPIYVATETGR